MIIGSQKRISAGKKKEKMACIFDELFILEIKDGVVAALARALDWNRKSIL